MSLKGRNFLTLKDFTKEEIEEFLDLAAELKEKKKKGIFQITVRTIKNELYKVCSSPNGMIESIEPISIEAFHTKALQGPSPDSP